MERARLERKGSVWLVYVSRAELWRVKSAEPVRGDWAISACEGNAEPYRGSRLTPGRETVLTPGCVNRPPPVHIVKLEAPRQDGLISGCAAEPISDFKSAQTPD